MGPEWWYETYTQLEEADPEFTSLSDTEQHERILDAVRSLADTYDDKRERVVKEDGT